MDISVNKPAKHFLKEKFHHWYSEEITKQLEGKDIDTVEIQPIDLSLQVLKEVGAKWLVEMADYISSNPQFIVNSFIQSGITDALTGTYSNSDDLDGLENTDVESSSDSEDESNFTSEDGIG